MSQTEGRYKLSRQMLDMLVCPLTKTQMTLTPAKDELISHAARLAFPIRKGVPLLCLDEARQLTEDEIRNI